MIQKLPLKVFLSQKNTLILTETLQTQLFTKTLEHAHLCQFYLNINTNVVKSLPRTFFINSISTIYSSVFRLN